MVSVRKSESGLCIRLHNTTIGILIQEGNEGKSMSRKGWKYGEEEIFSIFKRETPQRSRGISRNAGIGGIFQYHRWYRQ
jgi:hypothetical protein